MEDVDLIGRPASSSSGPENQNDSPSRSSHIANGSDFLPIDSDLTNTTNVEAPGSICSDPNEYVSEPIEADSQPLASDIKDEMKWQDPEVTSDNPCESEGTADYLSMNSEEKDETNGASVGVMSDGLHDNIEIPRTAETGTNEDDSPPLLPVNFELAESVADIERDMTSINSIHAENGSVPIQSKNSLSAPQKSGNLFNHKRIDAGESSGVKRPRVCLDGEQPSVHVIYNFLTRESKRKLEELLQQWSQWHALQNTTSSNGSDVVLESGEETYFPALCVGLDRPSAVTFWVDEPTMKQSSKEFSPLDGTSVPLYDRGYSLALTSADGSSTPYGGLEKDASRCFNCGSYSHALKDCPKPRDNAAVNNARKQHRSKRNQHASSRNSTRYYQSSRGGKYDGLRPGVLDPETRKVLGLGELDPPPWLTRMREIGYPPGYLEPDETDQPSGITIFGDETNVDESEEGEILDASYPKSSLKMTVEFPGINAPIPENADERLWAAASSSFSLYRDRSHRRYDPTPEYQTRGRYREQTLPRDIDDDGPPGCEPGTSPSLSYHFRRYAEYDSSYTSASPQSSPSIPWSPTFGRSISDRGRRSPLVRDGSPNYGRHGHGNYPRSSPR